jgi:6-phosphogluconolactonase
MFADPHACAEAAADAVCEGITRQFARAPTCRLAVPGGSTARSVLPVLAARQFPWAQVSIGLVDERWVAPDHPDSNEGLLRSLLQNRPAARARIVGMYDATRTPDLIHRSLVNDPLPDVVLLGMGVDGHIASIFPGDPANAATAPLAMVQASDHPRMTLTPLALRSARSIVLAFSGQAKLDTFNRACRPGAADVLPVRHVLSDRTRVFISA